MVRPMPVASKRAAIAVPPGAEVLLRDLIHERTGIYFEDGRIDMLLQKLEPLAQKRDCHSFLDLFYLLKYEENGVADWSDVADALAVQETYFWRETSQLEALTREVVPSWFKQSRQRMRIWSAACATGEEPLSIAMALVEQGWGDHPIEIDASDASPGMLEKARAGVYRERSFRTLPMNLREKYFVRAGTNWKIDPALARRVTYRPANLLAPDQISFLATAQVIFCRNCFIYFSRHAVRQVLASFASRMPREGYLFVGASESLLKLTADFELRQLGEAFVYVKV
jgi:chemotaxis protein methyltransferase CheR